MASATIAITAVEADLARAIRGEMLVSEFVRHLADGASVTAAPEPIDEFAGHVSRLSDAGVTPDETENLLVALVRAGVLSRADSLRLQGSHHRQQVT